MSEYQRGRRDAAQEILSEMEAFFRRPPTVEPPSWDKNAAYSHRYAYEDWQGRRSEEQDKFRELAWGIIEAAERELEEAAL